MPVPQGMATMPQSPNLFSSVFASTFHSHSKHSNTDSNTRTCNFPIQNLPMSSFFFLRSNHLSPSPSCPIWHFLPHLALRFLLIKLLHHTRVLTIPRTHWAHAHLRVSAEVSFPWNDFVPCTHMACPLTNFKFFSSDIIFSKGPWHSIKTVILLSFPHLSYPLPLLALVVSTVLTSSWSTAYIYSSI